MVCPNPAVRCNIGAAVITRNWNIQFRSEWKMEQVMVNGKMWQVCACWVLQRAHRRRVMVAMETDGDCQRRHVHNTRRRKDATVARALGPRCIPCTCSAHARCANMRTAAAHRAPLTRRHPRRQVNKQYKYGQLAILDVFTSMRIYHTSFAVYYNDIQGSTGATVYGNLVSLDPA